MPDDEPARGPVDRSLHMTEATARRLIDQLDRVAERTPARHIRRNQIISGFTGAVGLALFIVGVEKAAGDIPIISNAYGSIAVGILLLAITGTLLARLTGHDDTNKTP